jgi:ATP-dependent Clp protease protease subunit
MQTQLQIFNFSVVNQSKDSIDIHIDGDIVDSPTKEVLEKFWGDQTSTSYKSFRDRVPAGVKTVNVYVNSTGGHCGDSLAIHDYLIDLEAKGVTVNRIGRGIVASSGTYIVMGKNSELSENSWFMIHDVSGACAGTVDQIENQAKAMRKFNDAIVSFYSNHTGLSESKISDMMKKETWFTAKEAKEKGFVKKVTNATAFSNSIQNKAWPFSNMAVLNAYNSFAGKMPSQVKKVKPKNKFSAVDFWNSDEKKVEKKSVKNRFVGAYVPFKD